MRIITKQDFLVRKCEGCDEYHLITNEGMTKQTFIENGEERKQLKENLKNDIIHMLYDYEIDNELLKELEENITIIINNW